MRCLKTLSLVLVLLLALGAMATSASAALPSEFTSDGSVKVTGIGTGEAFTFEAGQKVACHGEHTIGKLGITPQGFFNPGTGLTTLTDQAHYKECVATVGATSLPGTTTTNGCDFVLRIGETTAETTEYGVTTDIVCEKAGEAIETHVYQNATHATSVCTYKIGPQTGLTGLDLKEASGGTLQLKGEVTGIAASRTGIVCGGTKETKAGIWHVNANLSGKNEGGGNTEVSVTDE